jgi:hypothetical protein
MDESTKLILSIILLFSSILMAILGWIKYFAERKLKMAKESEYHKLYNAIISKKISQYKYSDSKTIEASINQIRTLADDIIKYNIPENIMKKFKLLVNDLIVTRYTNMLFVDDVLVVQKALAFFEDRKKDISSEILILLENELQNKNDLEWLGIIKRIKIYLKSSPLNL